MNLDETISHLRDLIDRHDFGCEECRRNHEELLAFLEELKQRRQSAADVTPVVHGRWEKVKKSNSTWVCSVCGVKVGAFLAGCSEYCYHCGSKMDGDGGNETD